MCVCFVATAGVVVGTSDLVGGGVYRVRMSCEVGGVGEWGEGGGGGGGGVGKGGQREGGEERGRGRRERWRGKSGEGKCIRFLSKV